MTCAEPQYRASQEHTVRSFRPSVTTTTGFTDANVDATAPGLYVLPEDGTLRSQPRQVKSVAGTVATVDAPWATVGAVSAIRAWLPGDVPVVVTTANAATVISTKHAAVAAEPDTYWTAKGYYLVFISGANVGRAYPIATFVSATGTFTVTGTLAGATVVGDVALIRKIVRPGSDITASIKAKAIQRKIIGTGSQGGDMPIILANDGSVSLELEQRPIQTAGASGVVASDPIELGDILEDHFVNVSNTGGTVSAIDAATISTTAGVFTANGAVLLNNGRVAHILSSNGTTNITAYGPGQADNTKVTIGSVAYASSFYTRKTSGSITRCWDLSRGGKVRQLFHGCMPTLTIDIAREMPVKFKLAYTAGESLQYNIDRPVALNAPNPISIPDLGVPTDGKGARMVLDGVTVNVVSLTVNVGLRPGPRASLSGLGQMDGMFMGLEAPTGQFKIYADNDEIPGLRALADRLQSRIPMNALYQKGTAPKETWWLAMPTLAYVGGEFSYDGGQGVMTMDFTCVSPEAAVDHTNTALYPAATYPGLSELSFGWC